MLLLKMLFGKISYKMAHTHARTFTKKKKKNTHKNVGLLVSITNKKEKFLGFVDATLHRLLLGLQSSLR